MAVQASVFGGDVQPPMALGQAILHAAQVYNVPPDLLAGIWRVEANRHYPNPYVNSSGYGGAFGTTDWNGPIQDQANLSAQILAHALQSANGNVAQALETYSGGGYSSVPGESTFGTVISGTPGTHTLIPGSGSPTPSIYQKGISTATGPVTGAISGIESGITSATGAITTGFDFLTSWRFAEIVGGVLLLIVGLLIVGRSLGLGINAPGLPSAAPRTVASPETLGRFAE